MNKVDILCMASKKQMVGPVIIHRSILKNSDYFLNRGFKISILFKEGLVTKYQDLVASSNDLTFMRVKKVRLAIAKAIKGLILYSCKKNKFLTTLQYHFFDKRRERLVKNYLELNRNPSIVVTDSEREMFHLLKNRNSEFKTILFFHSDGIPMKMQLIDLPLLIKTRLYKDLIARLNFVIQNVDKIVFICKIGKDNFLKSYPDFDQSKLEVIPNGIENISFKKYSKPVLQKRPIKLCCVGSVSYRKGQDIIVNALSNTRDEILKMIHVDIVGAGPSLQILKQRTTKMKLSNNITFWGNIDNMKVDQILLDADIFILMSRNEGLPISIIEAMRAGLPIISTTISGIPELVENGVNGILLEPDPIQLTKVFNKIGKYSWAEMGKSSRRIFEKNYTIQNMISGYCDLYDNILKKTVI